MPQAVGLTEPFRIITDDRRLLVMKLAAHDGLNPIALENVGAVFGLGDRLREPDKPELQLGASPDDVSPERVLGGKQELERFMVAVRNLPLRSRTAFVLHRFEETTYASVAQRMDDLLMDGRRQRLCWRHPLRVNSGA